MASTWLALVALVPGAVCGVVALKLGGAIVGHSPPADWWTLGTVALVLTAVMVGATIVPALRAARLDPLRTLRQL